MQIAVISGSFLLGHATTNISMVYRGLGMGLWVSSAICIAQALGYQPVVTVGGGNPPGLFVNPNILGEISAVVLVALLFSQAWVIAIGVVPSLLLSQSRASFLAVAVCGAVWLCMTLWHRWGRGWQSKLTFLGLFVFLAASTLALPFLIGLTKWQSGSLTQRIEIWLDAINGLTWLGNGLGSFYSTYPAHATHLDITWIQPVHAHNDFLEVLFELGLPGLVLLLAFLAAIFWKSQQRERYILAAICVCALFGFPLHSPATAFTFGIVAGCAVRGWDVVRDRKLYSRQLLHRRGERVNIKLTGGSSQAVPV
jgi:O-antigen ligase